MNLIVEPRKPHLRFVPILEEQAKGPVRKLEQGRVRHVPETELLGGETPDEPVPERLHALVDLWCLALEVGRVPTSDLQRDGIPERIRALS